MDSGTIDHPNLQLGNPNRVLSKSDSSGTEKGSSGILFRTDHPFLRRQQRYDWLHGFDLHKATAAS